MLNAVINYTGREVLPIGGDQSGLMASRKVQALSSLLAGALVAVNTAANQNATVTLTSGGVLTGGSFVLQLPNGETVTIAYNATAAAIQTALRATGYFGANGCTVAQTTGATNFADSGAVMTITYAGPLGNAPVTTPTIPSSSLTGSTVTPAAGTAGNTNGALIAYDSTVVSPPVAPTVAGNGSGSSFAAGTYAVQVSFVTANGETTLSPATNVTVTAAQNLRVSAYSSVNSAITKARFWVNGVFAAETNVSGGNIPQTDIAGVSATARQPVLTNGAFTTTKGAYRPVGILRWNVYSDERGFVTYGTSKSITGVGSNREAGFWLAGMFNSDDVPALDQNAVTQLGARFTLGALGTAGSQVVIPA